MGRKSRDRKTPPPQAPAVGWRLLPPTDGNPDPAADDEALEGVLAAMEELRAEFVEAHGREPTEAEVIELVSLGLADCLDDDRIGDLLMDEEKTTLGPFSLDDGEEDGPDPAP